ncbi:MAG: serine/threonine protein kinase [Thermoanaerobaculia bacterium]|nr:serine/threonine protein kinase [Thermoanaerobaculia bacterium]
MPLLVRLVLALVLVGLVPTAVGLFQLRTQKDALLEQVQRSHIVAATSSAARVDAFLRPWLDLASTLASHPALAADPRSQASQELLRGLLATRSEVAVLGLFSADGETVLMARRPGMEEELPSEQVASSPDTDGTGPHVELVQGASASWLRVVAIMSSGPQDATDRTPPKARLVLVASTEALKPAVQAPELGDQAILVLASLQGSVLVGGADGLQAFPQEAVDIAASGKVGSGCSVYRDNQGEQSQDVVVAHARVAGAPWFVMSRQPAIIAEEARLRLQRAAWMSGAMALGLTLVLASVAWSTVIRPIRRLADAQRDLVGGAATGSEIADLEQTFELLRQRIHDKEDLGQIFIGRYQVTDLVGSGAMGSVFRGWDAKLRRPVALKTVHLDAEAVDQRKLLKNLREEAAITARIHQPNIVTVYDIEEQGHVAFLAMEYIEGADLQTLLDRRGALEPEEVIPLAAQIARGLAVAHEHGLVHHDIKPGNILLGAAGEVKLTDFGVSQLISASTKVRDVICGTPGYLAPECFAGGKYGPEADLWAFGVVLYQCLSGHQPFRGRNLRSTISQTLHYDPDPLDLLFPGIEPDLADLVHALIDKDPDRRPTSSRAVSERLDELMNVLRLDWRPDPSLLVRRKRPRRPTTLQEEATQLFSTQIVSK